MKKLFDRVLVLFLASLMIFGTCSFAVNSNEVQNQENSVPTTVEEIIVDDVNNDIDDENENEYEQITNESISTSDVSEIYNNYDLEFINSCDIPPLDITDDVFENNTGSDFKVFVSIDDEVNDLDGESDISEKLIFVQDTRSDAEKNSNPVTSDIVEDFLDDTDGKENTGDTLTSEDAESPIELQSIYMNYIEVEFSSSSSNSIVQGNLTLLGKLPPNTSFNFYVQNKASGEKYVTHGSKKGITFSNTNAVAVPVSTNQKTLFWRLKLRGTYGGKDVNYTSKRRLYNKKALRYWRYKEVYTNKRLWAPPTNLAVNPISRSATFRSKYIANFTEQYPKANVDWSSYEIHHMRPLKYGGSNSTENGIALTTARHKKVTAWWNNY